MRLSSIAMLALALILDVTASGRPFMPICNADAGIVAFDNDRDIGVAAALGAGLDSHNSRNFRPGIKTFAATMTTLISSRTDSARWFSFRGERDFVNLNLSSLLSRMQI